MFLGCWDREGGNVTPTGSHKKLWGSAERRMTEDWDEGAGDGRGGLSSEGASPPRGLGETASVVTPEVMQPKTEPRGPGISL